MMNPARRLLCMARSFRKTAINNKPARGQRLSCQQHGLGMLERFGLAMNHDDVAFAQGSFRSGLAAQNSLAADAGEDDLSASRAHFFERTADSPGARWNHHRLELFAVFRNVLDLARAIAYHDVSQNCITA